MNVWYLFAVCTISLSSTLLMDKLILYSLYVRFSEWIAPLAPSCSLGTYASLLKCWAITKSSSCSVMKVSTTLPGLWESSTLCIRSGSSTLMMLTRFGRMLSKQMYGHLKLKHGSIGFYSILTSIEPGSMASWQSPSVPSCTLKFATPWKKPPSLEAVTMIAFYAPVFLASKTSWIRILSFPGSKLNLTSILNSFLLYFEWSISNCLSYCLLTKIKKCLPSDWSWNMLLTYFRSPSSYDSLLMIYLSLEQVFERI